MEGAPVSGGYASAQVEPADRADISLACPNMQKAMHSEVTILGLSGDVLMVLNVSLDCTGKDLEERIAHELPASPGETRTLLHREIPCASSSRLADLGFGESSTVQLVSVPPVPLIIEFCTDLVRCGFAGDSMPRVSMISAIGSAGLPMPSLNIKAVYVGQEALNKRGVLRMKYLRPELGKLNLYVPLFEEVFHEMNVDPSLHPVVIVEPAWLSSSDVVSAFHSEVQEVFSAGFGVLDVRVMNVAPLLLAKAVRACNQDSKNMDGCLLDVGKGGVRVVPVRKGVASVSNIVTCDTDGFSGSSVVDAYGWAAGIHYSEHRLFVSRPLAEESLAESCYIAPDPAGDPHASETAFSNPDGSITTIPAEARWSCFEPMFSHNNGVQRMIFEAMKEAYCEVGGGAASRRFICDNVVLSGRLPLLPGFVERLTSELAQLCGDATPKVHAAQTPYDAWIVAAHDLQ